MSASESSAGFGVTRWTLVQRAQGETSEARAALGELCEFYYLPVFRFLCREGRSDDAARELVQGFFAKLLERGQLKGVEARRGRFRSYLLGALKHYLQDQRDWERRRKRGGGVVPASLDAGDADQGGWELADAAAQVSDTFFDRQWALTVMERSLERLRSEFEREGKSAHFDRLKPWLAGDTERLSQEEVGRLLGWSETRVKVAIHRLRKRFREAVRGEVAQTVAEGTDIDEELKYLVEVLSG